MSDLENKKQEETPKKRPYNLREKKEKKAAYRSLIRPELADELYGQNYSCLLNEYRVKDALHLLTDKRYADKNVEEISAMVGFANRQSFYAAFYKNVGKTPNGYRKEHVENSKK